MRKYKMIIEYSFMYLGFLSIVTSIIYNLLK